MLGGGVKGSSNDRYIKNFMEFWRTMRRLGVSDKDVWTFPSKTFVIQLYVVDCAKVRKKRNSWDTIRNKLRSIDYVAQLCGVKQEWAKNPGLHALVSYCKLKCKSTGSTTLPITKERVEMILNHVVRKKVNTREKRDKVLTENWEIRDFQEWSMTQLKWYQWCIAIVFAFTLGLRGAEQYKNDEEHMREYGIKLKDISWMWMLKGQLKRSNKFTLNTEKLESMILRLRNSKTRGENEEIILALGKNEGEKSIIYLVFRWYHYRKLQGGEYWKEMFLFSLKLGDIKEMWKQVISKCGIV